MSPEPRNVLLDEYLSPLLVLLDFCNPFEKTQRLKSRMSCLALYRHGLYGLLLLSDPTHWNLYYITARGRIHGVSIYLEKESFLICM